MNDYLYTVDEIAQILRISPYTTRKWLREGKLQGTKQGKSWRMTTKQLTEHLQEKHNE